MMSNMWTKYRTACETLDLEYEHTIFDIKSQYRAKALLYHPDKCSEEGAAARFQEIQAAYEYLKEYKESPLDGCDGNLDKRGDGCTGGMGFKDIICMIMHKMAKICEKKTRQLLEGLEIGLLERLVNVLELYPATIPETIREMVREVVDTRRGQTECIIINPLLDDIMADNLYPFVRDGKTYILPLWHHELVYDVEGAGDGGAGISEMVIQIIPILPDNVMVDADNNLHVHLTYRLLDIWESRMGLVDGHEGGWIKFYLGGRSFVIQANQICMAERQKLVLVGQGISRICHTDIYDVSQRGDVVVHLAIYH